jgi:uncharacterized protein
MKEIECSISSIHGYGLQVTSSLPTDGPVRAAVIMLHGFGTGRNNKLNLRLAPWLAERGIAGVRFDFAGHGKSEGTTRGLTIASAADDIRTVYRAFDNLVGVVDQPRGAVASSFGAAALLRCVRDLSELKAIVLRAPISDYAEVRRLQFGSEGIRKWEDTGVLSVQSSRGRLESGYPFYADAMAHDVYAEVANLPIPTLVLQGSNDEDVPVEHTKRLVAVLGARARLEIIVGANHSFGNEAHFHLLFAEMTNFLLLNLFART